MCVSSGHTQVCHIHEHVDLSYNQFLGNKNHIIASYTEICLCKQIVQNITNSMFLQPIRSVNCIVQKCIRVTGHLTTIKWGRDSKRVGSQWSKQTDKNKIETTKEKKGKKKKITYPGS